MASTNRILSKQSLNEICKSYNIYNKMPFTVNLLSYMLLIQNNSYKADIGFKYRIYFYRNIFNIQYNKTKNLWDRMLFLFFKKASVCLDFNDIKLFTNQLTSTIQNCNNLIDTIELILYKYQDTSIQNVQEFSDIFTITRDNSNNTFINGEKIIDNNVRMTLYKLSASSIKTIINNSLYFTNITNDISDNNIDNSCQSCINFNDMNHCVTGINKKITTLENNLIGINNKIISLTNGLITNNEEDVIEMNKINMLQMTKANMSTTINGYRLDSNIILNKDDIGLNNIDNTSDLNKPISIQTQNALDLKVNKTTTINDHDLNSNIILDKNDIGLNNIDNTSDLDKPISIQQQIVFDYKVDKTTTINGHGLNNSIILNKYDIGLDNVNNTSDLDKPISLLQQTEFNKKVDKTTTINGYDLNSNIILDKYDINLGNIDNTSDINKPISTYTQNALDLKVNKTTTINGHDLNSNIILDKDDIGLNNIDNTSDLNKPISTYTQNALDLKVNKTTTINGHDLNSNIILDKNDIGLNNIDNTSDLNKPISNETQLKLDTINNAIIVVSNLLNTKVNSFLTINNYSLNDNIVLNKNDIGLDKIDNTSDLNKPISIQTQNALDLKENLINKNVAYGYAGLDNNGKVPLSLMPPIIGSSLLYLGTWDAHINQPQILNGIGDNGNYYKVSVSGTSSIDNINSWNIGDWIIFNGTKWQKIINNDLVSSVNSKVGNVIITKNDIGLNNVDNTSDFNKPVSNSVQNILDNKINILQSFSINNIPIINSNGMLSDSLYNISDEIITNYNIWSSNKIMYIINNKTEFNLPNFNFNNFSYPSLRNYFSTSQSESKLFSFNNNQLLNNNSYAGSVYSPYEDRIYFVPFNQTNQLHYIDCKNGSIQNIQISNLVQNAYIGGVYSPNENKIYFAPYKQNNILHYIDCNLGIIIEYQFNTNGAISYGAVYSPKQNRIYFIPHSSHNEWMYIDCNTGSIIKYLHGLQILDNAYAGGVYSPTEDRIYFVPYAQNNKFCYLDCSNTKPIEYISNVSINQNAYIGGVYSPTNNFIYFIPYNQNQYIHYIDCNNNGIIGSIPYNNNNKYAGGVYINKQIYLIPYENGILKYINTDNNQLYNMDYVNGSFFGGSYSPTQNRIYATPHTTDKWIYIQLLDNNNISKSLMANALFNKL